MNLEIIKLKMPIVLKWILICCLIGIFSGTASALFLGSLEYVTQIRENNSWIIWMLPLGGLLIGYLYFYSDPKITKGNNLLLEEYKLPSAKIPFLMAPVVLLGTLITHLFGGSAGREGTAVQMGGAIADLCSPIFKLTASERQTIIILGISAGFASVFGTPLAGALFALEIVVFYKINFKKVVLSFLVAFIAYYTVEFWKIKHTHYSIPTIPEMNFSTLAWVIVVSIAFGLAALVFARSAHFWSKLFSKTIKYPPLRPFVGGIILALSVYFIGTTKYIGLGIPMIVEAFTTPNLPYDFILKILFTGFTLGAGFKGGEVTPLFFVGATLGSALSVFVPLPIALLAGMGFVAVFAGATHTPIACTVMGMELFGLDCGLYIGLACIIGYFSSGSIGIYKSQTPKGPKFHFYQKLKKREAKIL